MRPADERFCRHTSRHYARDRCYISFFLDDHRTSRLMQHLCQPQEKPLKPLIAACPRSLIVLACFPSPCVLSGTTSCAARLRSPMACKVKGIFKGLKAFSRIFAVKEHEMEIGCPTDVKHVAHIGWDSAAGGASPSWMNDIMASSDLSSLGNFAALTGTSWVSQAKNQTQQWAAWTHQEEEIFFNALQQVGKNFDKITHRVQSKNKDQVSHYYYRLVRRMKKLLGPRFSLDAKNSKDTIAAMLRWTTKNQTRQWAAWTHQEEEIFFNALRQVGKVSHYYYRLVRRMKKLLGPRFSLDAKNSKDTIAAMLRCLEYWAFEMVVPSGISFRSNTRKFSFVSQIVSDAMRLFLEDANSPQASHENEIFAKYVEDSVRKAFLHSNLALADVSVINHSFGTTVLSFFWYHNTDSIDLWEVRQLLVANAEDYRIVLCRKGIAVDMSKDHRPTYDAEHQRVIECGGYIEDGYLNGVLSMTRALGD
ncbi:putative protein phosphatase 2C 2 [Zea mays]|uniref:protein-serine/threonine phosphatase n=1 Tax=Zea mays TaxID=4577 RepID=A0A3L6FZF2_MAIZE|nr:putative protein phosphatase 2C 2 [Zea mays]